MWTLKHVQKDNSISNWCCVCRSSHKCTAVLCTKEISPGRLECISVTPHCHDPSPEAIVRARAASLARDAASNSPLERVHNIVADVVNQTPLQQHLNLDERSLKRSIYAARKHSRAEFEQEEGVYTDLQNLHIPLHLLQNRGESLLLGDSGPGSDRILMFGARRHASLFLRGTTVLADGTFQIVPRLWAQQYTFHLAIDGFHVPVFYFLVPGKTKAMYKKKFLRWYVKLLVPICTIRSYSISR